MSMLMLCREKSAGKARVEARLDTLIACGARPKSRTGQRDAVVLGVVQHNLTERKILNVQRRERPDNSSKTILADQRRQQKLSPKPALTVLFHHESVQWQRRFFVVFNVVTNSCLDSGYFANKAHVSVIRKLSVCVECALL